MARFIDLQIEGLPVLNRAFARLPYVLQGKVLRPALRDASRIVLDRARQLAPRRSGRLAAGKWTIRAATGRKGIVGVRVNSPTREQLGIPATATGFYPYSQEFGWVAGRRRAGSLRGKSHAAQTRRRIALAKGTARKIPGRRFMHAALFGAQDQVRERVGQVMSERINLIAPGALAGAQQELDEGLGL